MTQEFRLQLLGGFRLEKDGARVQLYSRKVESLLAYLALFPQEHAREKIAALLWGESSDEQARMSLRRALNDLRKQLGADALLTDRETVHLNPDFSLWMDTREFKDECRRMKDENALLSGASSFILHPLSFDLLPDFYEDWLEPPREELRSLFLDTALKLIDHARAQSEYKLAIELAQKILSVDKANEAAHQHLMFCYSAMGDRAAALDQYEFCKRALREELGIEPSKETRALFETIRKQTETKSTAARLTNLPRPTTSFVGREHEVQEIRAMLGRGEAFSETNATRATAANENASPLRAITLTGPGGSGKTRLAIESALHLVSEFPDGVWWVELAPLADESLVPQQIAKALGVQEQPNVSILETLRENLYTKQLLLVLDNCEHVIDACAQLVNHLINESPNLVILATSREGLNIVGEQLYPVAPLAVPRAHEFSLAQRALEFTAVRLFVERARLASPQFVFDDAQAAHVIQICQRLDGIPLAIELAAARVKQLNVREIAARLDSRFDLLVGARTVLPRQQTLRALMDWSFDLLNEDEKILFRRLCVFAGGWSIEAAQEVCADDVLPRGKVLDTLLRLIDKSLLARTDDAETRYTMLETIREYAHEKLLAAKERLSPEELHRRASDWFGQNNFPDEAIYHASSARDYVLMQRWIEKFGFDLGFYGKIATVKRWLRLVPSEALIPSAQLCLVLAQVYFFDDDFDKMDTEIRKGEQALAQLDNPVLRYEIECEFASMRVDSAAFRGNSVAAIEMGESLVARLPPNSFRMRGELLHRIGTSYLLHGNTQLAMELFEKAVVDSSQAKDYEQVALSVSMVAELQATVGRLERAKELYLRAIETAGRHGLEMAPITPVMHIELALLYAETLEFEKAGYHAERSRVLIENANIKRLKKVVYALLAKLALLDSNLSHARHWVEVALGGDALAQFRPLHSYSLVAQAQLGLWLAEGKIEAAVEWVEGEGLASVEQVTFYNRHTGCSIAEVWIANRENVRALAILDHVRAHVLQFSWEGDLVLIDSLRAMALAGLGQKAQALEAVGHALALGVREGYVLTFVARGASMYTLLNDFRAELTARAESRQSSEAVMLLPYVDRILAAFPQA